MPEPRKIQVELLSVHKNKAPVWPHFVAPCLALIGTFAGAYFGNALARREDSRRDRALAYAEASQRMVALVESVAKGPRGEGTTSHSVPMRLDIMLKVRSYSPEEADAVDVDLGKLIKAADLLNNAANAKDRAKEDQFLRECEILVGALGARLSSAWL